MRLKWIMAFFGQLKYSLCWAGCGYILGGFLFVGGIFYHNAAGIWKGIQKGTGRRIPTIMYTYIRISISESFITGASISTLFVQVRDCQLRI